MRYELRDIAKDEQVKIFPLTAKFIDLPNGGRVSPLQDGWKGGGDITYIKDQKTGKETAIEGDALWAINKIDDEPAPEPDPYEPRRVGTFIEFMDLFTDEQQAQIYATSASQPSLGVLIIRASASNEIDLDAPQLPSVLALLVHLKIIDQTKSSEIQTLDFDK